MLHERRSRLTGGQAALSSSEPELAPGRGRAAQVGAELRSRRLQYGWELEAVAASLRIRVAYLEALEAGRVADLPGNAYALGFLRSYATVLGLDPDAMSRRFRAEAAELNAKTELTFPAPVPERGVPAGAVILLGVVLAIGAYVGWYRLTEHGQPAGAVPPVPPKLAHLAEPTLLAPKPVPAPAVPPRVTYAANPVVAPSSTSPSEPAAAPAPSTPAAASSSMPAATGPAETGSTTIAARSSPANAAAATGTPSSATATPSGVASGGTTSAGVAAGTNPASPPSIASGAVAALAPPAQAAPAPPAPAGTIIVRAVAEAWVEVRDASGTIIFTKLMQPGESWTAPREPGLTLTTGNAGGTELLVDGKVAASLGAPGEVERNQPLDPELIKSGALPAQIAAAAAPQATHSNLRLAQ